MFVYENAYNYNFFQVFSPVKKGKLYIFFYLLLTGFYPIMQSNMYLFIIINASEAYGTLKHKASKVNRLV